MRAFTNTHERVDQGRAHVFCTTSKEMKSNHKSLKDEDGWNGWMNGWMAK